MQDSTGKISVSASIVTYNNSSEITQTISSVLNNTHDVNLSLYISDNNSTDDTLELVKKQFPQVKIIHNSKNGGFGYGHNRVLNQINSKYHVVINPDIMLKQDSISSLVDKLENDHSVVMCTSKILNEDGTEQYLPKRNPKLKYLFGGRLERFGGVFEKLRAEYTMKNIEISSPQEIEFCTGCFFVIRTDAFKKLKGFDDRFFMYFEDADLSRRAKKYGKIVFYPDIEVIHLWERASTKSTKFFIIQIISMFKYFLKWSISKKETNNNERDA